MDWINIITLIIGSGGVIGGAVSVYQIRKNSSSAAAKTEVEAAAQESADWSAFTERIQAHMDRQDKEIWSLKDEIQGMKQERQADLAHIDLLNYWINNNLGPPPPRRGTAYPEEDQIGG